MDATTVQTVIDLAEHVRAARADLDKLYQRSPAVSLQPVRRAAEQLSNEVDRACRSIGNQQPSQ
jgi:hypothetical protein